MAKLIKQFNRERSLFYIFVWQDSEYMGYSKWLGYQIKNSLYLNKGKDNKVTIWYGKKDIENMRLAIEKKIKNLKMLDQFKKSADKDWAFLEQFVVGNKNIESINTLKKYYRSIISWWSVMTLVYFIPDIEKIGEDIRKEADRMRVQTERYSAKFNNIFERYFIRNYPKYSKYVKVISPNEVFKLEKMDLTSKEIDKLEKRLKGYALLNKKLYSLGNFKKEMNIQKLALEDDYAVDGKSFTGRVAFKGKVKGRVQVLLHKKDIRNFKNGKILVTDMTDPDFLPAMKKAIAFITDEGSITCHASIVARELKKPCIIGTKVATKVLKDGDLVEVDAEKGIVKIITFYTKNYGKRTRIYVKGFKSSFW